MNSFCFLSHAGSAPLVASDWDLSPEHSLMLPVQPGDLLQALRGTVWITIDGDPRDLMLGCGDLHTVTQEAVLRVSGFDAPRLKLLSRRPVQAQPLHVARGWRDWLAWAATWAQRRQELTTG